MEGGKQDRPRACFNGTLVDERLWRGLLGCPRDGSEAGAVPHSDNRVTLGLKETVVDAEKVSQNQAISLQLLLAKNIFLAVRARRSRSTNDAMTARSPDVMRSEKQSRLRISSKERRAQNETGRQKKNTGYRGPIQQ